jgi:hypothetical protein
VFCGASRDPLHDQALDPGLAEQRQQHLARRAADGATVFPEGKLAGLGAVKRLTLASTTYLADGFGAA